MADETPVATPPKPPTEEEMYFRWCLGNHDAVACVKVIGAIAQIADDFADGDVPEADRQERMADLLLLTLSELPNNPFWAARKTYLEPTLLVSLEYWRASNIWHKSENRTQRMWGYIARDDFEHLVVLIAMVLGGSRHAQRVLQEMNEFYKIHRAETFEEWEAERV